MTSVKLDWSQVLGDQPQNGSGDFWGNVLGDQPNYLQRTIANIPESAAGVGHAMIHPEEDAAAAYELGKRIKAKYGSEGLTGVAHSAASHLYNSIVGLPTSFEKDPVGTAVGAGALLVGGPEAALAKGVRAADEAAVAARTASLPQRIASLPEIPAAPAAERAAALKAKAGEQMNIAKASGETLPTTTMEPIVADIKAKADEEGYNPRIHKKAKALFKEFDAMLPQKEAGPDMTAMMSRMAPVPRAALEKRLAELTPAQEVPTTTLKDIHQLRQQIRSVSASSDPNERLVGWHMKDGLDEYMGQFMEGDRLTEGIKDYAKASTALEMKAIVDRAAISGSQLSAGQKAAAINKELRKFALNKAKMRMLRAVSPEGAAKLEKAASGGAPLQQILKGLGSAAPSSIMSFSLDNIAGHLLHGIIPGGPYTIMGIGAAAKYFGGKMAGASIEDIQDTILAGPRIASLQKKVSPSVFQTLMSRPRTAQAIRNWAKANGDRKRIATIALTSAIAKEVNRPDLQKRLQDEIDNIDPERQTIVPKTQTAEMQ